jgi:hypothetical protein
MLEVQLRLLSYWMAASEALRSRVEEARHDDRGEVTATTVIIVLLVGAALIAGGVIASKITDNANNVPSP